MKKLLTFAILAMVGVASAANINWTLATGGDSNYMVGKNGNALSGTAYLLLASDLSDFSSEADIAAIALDSVSIENGVNKQTQVSDNSSRLTAPNEYTFTLIVYDSGSDSYFTSGSTKVKAAYNAGADQDHYGTATEVTFNARDLYATSALRGTQTFTAVPEPATGALALAGVALLFRRRRA